MDLEERRKLSGELRKPPQVLVELRGFPLLLAQHHLAVQQFEQAARVGLQGGVLLQVRFCPDRTSRLPAPALLHAQGFDQF